MLVNPVRWVKDKIIGHPLEAYWEIEVRDANGKLLKFRRNKAKSLLPQFLGLLKGQFMLIFDSDQNAGNSPVTDISGTVRYYPYTTTVIYRTCMCMCAGIGVDEYGLVVGSSDAPNAINQYAMGAKIPHGNESGKLYYGAISFENTSNPPGTNNWIIRIIRTFSNNSGSSITVKEIGLIVKAYDSTASARLYLIARDVISPVTVPAGSTLTVRYILKITVS
jgi:hypothetical protein